MYEVKISTKRVYVLDGYGVLHNITGTGLISDYIKHKKIPSVDALLDWRSRLDVLKAAKKYPAEWYDKEILATDYLLSKKQGVL